MKSLKTGFTLIELLVVIGILAVLATITILVLNPAQLFAQGRDSQRISDLSTLRSAISLYLATVSSPDLDGAAACGTNCWTHLSGAGVNCEGRHTGLTTAADTDRTVDGTGWVPVDLTDTAGGAPVAALPIDPSDTTTYFYSYLCDSTNTTFELNANMESTRYANGGDDDVEATDGGNSATLYEVGSDPGLDL
ncbi:MAG: type II secretion system protein [bacterium]|nr:type II secretion system protein [bacterium]